MKRLISFSILAMVLILISGCSLAKKPPVNLVDAPEIRDKIDSKETFILVIGNKAQCSLCENYIIGGLSSLDEKDDYKVDYIMVDTIEKQEDMDTLTEIVYKDFSESENSMLGVPTTYFIDSGSLVNKQEGVLSYEELSTGYDELFNE